MRLNLQSLEAALVAVVLALAGLGAGVLRALEFPALLAGPLSAWLAACALLLAGGLWRLALLWRAQQESVRRLTLLAEMNVVVNREILLNEDMELIYRTILNYLFRVFNTASTGSVLILGEDGHLRFAAARGFTEEFIAGFHLRLEDSFLHQVTGGDLREARLITEDALRRVRTVFEPGAWQYRSVISAPLFVGERLIGLLNLDSPVEGTYDTQDLEIVERFRTQIEVGLLARERYTANIRRYQVDALTGLLTRRYFEDVFQLSLAQAQRHHETFVLGLFDVDGLKQANDRHGHLAGDQLLVSIASALRSSCRTSDIMGRFGGDEFIACYHRTDVKTMERHIAAIRTRLRARPLRFGGAEQRPSFSYGLARFPEDGRDLASLLAVADKRLYAMKSGLR